jgi:peptide/nickel transport system substrate-binding protein
MQRGDFEMGVAWGFDGPSPYIPYKWLMSSATVRPLGEVATGNFHRFGDARVDALLSEFEQTADEAEQHRIMAEVQARFVATAPAIPLFANPLWSETSTRRIEGFPTADDPYAKPSPHAVPDCLLVLVNLRPRSE